MFGGQAVHIYGAPKIQIGDSGGIETTGYIGIDVFAGTGGASVYGGTGQTDGWGPSWTLIVIYYLFKANCLEFMATNGLVIQWRNNMTHGYFIRFTGYKELSAELTQFKFLLPTGALLMIATVIYA